MIIVSGLSGSGKSIALQTLEDLGYYCVDNLPVALLKPFAQEIVARENGISQTTAVGIDARNFLDELQRFPEILGQLRSAGLEVEILFLHAADEALFKRYSETRRKHPLSSANMPLVDAVRRERRLLDTIMAHASLIIDTSHTNIHELRKLVRSRLDDRAGETMSILFESFAFKQGVPADADFVFDVRCLPNPHWEPKLRHLTGLAEDVAKFLTAQPDVTKMVEDLRHFLETWLPHFETGTRSYLTIAVGCTGGQHRSVFIVEQLAGHFSTIRSGIMIRHRELT
jgi:UPF0042 nucleotide-binding protein